MGGGDLNTKKSWHPNTMKNQERVWKAEQAAAQEKKRIVELQQERAAERDRAELNTLSKLTSGTVPDDRLSWMYTKPDKKGNQEEYLLGKTIDSNYDRPERPEDAIPAVARRVVGASMVSAGGAGDAQVDLVRKMREDPLLLVKERERAARAALLNNPLQRRKLTELLRKEQEQRKIKKAKKSKKNDLDDKLAEKLNALSSKKGIDLAALLASDDSSSESSSTDEKSKKKKKKKKSKSKKSKKKSKESPSEEDDSSCDDTRHTDRQGANLKQKDHRDDQIKSKRSRRERSRSRSKDKRDRSNDHDKYKERVPKRAGTDRYNRETDEKVGKVSSEYYREDRRDNNPNRSKDNRREDHSQRAERRERSPVRQAGARGRREKGGPSAEERAARLAEMARAGAQHERERGTRVAQQRADIAAEDAQRARAGASGRDARALPASLEARIHSNRHNIQRNERHMNEHFARR